MGNALSMNKKTFAELPFAPASVFMAHLLNADRMINRIIPMVLALWLGSMLQVPGQQSEQEKALAQIKANAEKGDPEAQLEMGLIYAGGASGTRDAVKAAKWHRKAADQGLARAQYQVGLDYANGEGVKISQTEAIKWFRRAADQGLVEAQYELGVCCLSGRGIRESGTAAVDWFRKAAGQGFANAEYQIGKCYFEGTGIAKNIEEGIKWIRSAAEKGVAVAQDKLGDCYQKGEGVPKDYVEAYKWFALAAAQDDAHSLDIKVSLARLESYLTKDQIVEAQRLAREFKPVQTSDRTASLPSGSPSQPSSLAKPTHPVVNAPVALESVKAGYVTVKANDEHCEVFVDGAFVGNSPAKLKLPEGLHVVEVKKSGFKDYRRELKVLTGSDLTLAAELEKP